MLLSGKRKGVAVYSFFANGGEDGVITVERLYERQPKGMWTTDELKEAGLYQFNGFEEMKQKVKEKLCHGEYQIESVHFTSADFTRQRYIIYVYEEVKSKEIVV